MEAVDLDRPRWRVNAPFWLMHVLALVGAVWVGWSWAALAWLAGGYAVRMFGVTAGYHRYFAHRTYRAGRGMQLVLAVLGASAAQKGPLWWAAHHRRHHKHSDEPGDVHSPKHHGVWGSHLGWFLGSRHVATDLDAVPDLARFPELRFIDRFHDLVIVGACALALLFGGVTGLVWGGFVAIVLSWHSTFTINSLAHVWGRRRYATDDDSRNNGLLALITFGEGWHNNHHHYQRSARQGFYWWEVDLSYYALKTLEAMRLVRDVRGVPAHVRDALETRVAALPVIAVPRT
jgi:stearoyl-CoA desaturase (Delta-9 desaturase)